MCIVQQRSVQMREKNGADAGPAYECERSLLVNPHRGIYDTNACYCERDIHAANIFPGETLKAAWRGLQGVGQFASSSYGGKNETILIARAVLYTVKGKLISHFGYFLLEGRRQLCILSSDWHTSHRSYACFEMVGAISPQLIGTLRPVTHLRPTTCRKYVMGLSRATWT